VDFRLITATNRDRKKEVGRGAFREDLYFRLNVVAFELPPLRKRVEDILPLCQRAIVRFAQEFGKPVPDLDPDARRMLERYAYPGNIRELQNILERALIFCQGRMLTPTCLPSELLESAPKVAATTGTGREPIVRVEMKVGEQTLEDVERAIIDEVLRVSDYNKTVAAKHLGVSRFALDRRLKKGEEE
jgi:two-component system response regulator AtoC